MKLTVVIPSHNQEKTLAGVVEKVGVSCPAIEKEIIVIDDGSTDGTRALLETRLQGKVHHCLFQQKPLGWGASIRAAVEVASGDVILIQDACGAFDPGDYARLLPPILEGRADVVLGSRVRGGEPRQLPSWWWPPGNFLLTGLFTLFTGKFASDIGSACKVFRRDILKSIFQEENGFGFDAELIAKLTTMPSVRVCEVGVSYSEPAGGSPRTWPRTFEWRTLWSLCKYSLVRRRGGRTTWRAAIRLAAFVVFSLLLLQESWGWRTQGYEKFPLSASWQGVRTPDAVEATVATIKGHLPAQGQIGYFTNKGSWRLFVIRFHFAPLQLEFGAPGLAFAITDFPPSAKDVLADDKNYTLLATFPKAAPDLRDLRIYKRRP